MYVFVESRQMLSTEIEAYPVEGGPIKKGKEMC